MTGASYAALPLGPQLNNYKELNDLIWAANSDDAEPLSRKKQKIISKICTKFPNTRSVYDASHLEYVWENRTSGEIIPYTDSFELTQI